MSRKRFVSCLIAAVLMSTPAVANVWNHAAGSMGQYEGGIAVGDGSHGISYGCSSTYGNLTFYATGVHAQAGDSVIEVDGQEVARGTTIYNSSSNNTLFSLDVQYSYGPESWTHYNSLMDALASGSEAVWTTPTNEAFNFPLSGSADLRSCMME